MLSIYTSNDPSEIAFAKMLLISNGITPHIADVHTSIIEGSVGILPQRIMVPKDHTEQALEILRDNKLIQEPR